MDQRASSSQVAVVGGGPAGLMAAEVARSAGMRVDIFDRKGSVGRKFLIAGKGGLNLTHSEQHEKFVQRFGARRSEVARWLAEFDANAVRGWARELGVETFIGSSGRVFPVDLKAAPLLRGWVRRLRESGVRFHMHHHWRGWDDAGALRFFTVGGERSIVADAVVLALGGGSYAKLGADGAWLPTLSARGVAVAALQPSNCGFDVEWSDHFAARHQGQPLKSVTAGLAGDGGIVRQQRGELIVTATGVEGSLVYALSAELRDEISARGFATLVLDLAPDRTFERLFDAVARPRGHHSLAKHLKRAAGIEGVKVGLLHEHLEKTDFNDAAKVARAIKSLPIRLVRARPIDEAISTAGGVDFSALDEHLMLRAAPGTFCAGEMLDWEAPTGGYLITACLASGRAAGLGAVEWLRARGPTAADERDGLRTGRRSGLADAEPG